MIPVGTDLPTSESVLPERFSSLESGNLMPLLHEIRHALELLDLKGQQHLIDLQGIPFASDELVQLDAFLGRGEVHAEITAMGRSTLHETRFSGVWRVTHYDDVENIIGQLIEITYAPQLLGSQPEDLHASRILFDRELAEF